MPELIEHEPSLPVIKQSAGPLDVTTRDFNAGLKRRKANRDALIDWIRDALVSGVDFMRVKTKRRGWSKPFLTKPGAEKVLGMLGVTPTYPNIEAQADNISSGKSTIMVVQCVLVNQAGESVGTGAGGRTLEQDGGDINKMIKMCLKSAMIDATLRLGGLSELFTQDEESAHDDEIERSINEEQVKTLRAAAKKAKLPIANICKFYDIEKIEALPVSKFLRAQKAITKKIDEKCPDGLTPDGETCPRCGGKRGPSGIDGGTWVHTREK